jgi:hypothetical protein
MNALEVLPKDCTLGPRKVPVLVRDRDDFSEHTGVRMVISGFIRGYIALLFADACVNWAEYGKVIGTGPRQGGL